MENVSPREPSLGEFLRQQRERRGASIEQVASATKINVRMLHALESDQFGDLPAKPFVRGFVISYTRFLGIDAKEVMARYATTLDENCQSRPEREAGTIGYAFEKQSSEKSRTVLWIAMATFIVVGWVVFLVLKPAFRHRRVSHVDALRASQGTPSAPAAAPVPAAVAPEKKAETKIETKPETTGQTKPEPKTTAVVAAEAPKSDAGDSEEKADPLNKGDVLKPEQVKEKVVIKTLADVWLRYRVDDRTQMKFLLKADKVIVFKAEKRIAVQFSNPEAVRVRYRSSEFREPDAVSRILSHNATPTLVFPKEQSEKIGEIITADQALPVTSAP